MARSEYCLRLCAPDDSVSDIIICIYRKTKFVDLTGEEMPREKQQRLPLLPNVNSRQVLLAFLAPLQSDQRCCAMPWRFFTSPGSERSLFLGVREARRVARRRTPEDWPSFSIRRLPQLSVSGSARASFSAALPSRHPPAQTTQSASGDRAGAENSA